MKKSPWLFRGFVGDNTAQLYSDYNKPNQFCGTLSTQSHIHLPQIEWGKKTNGDFDASANGFKSDEDQDQRECVSFKR